MSLLNRFVIRAKNKRGTSYFLGKHGWFREIREAKSFTSDWWPRNKVIPQLKKVEGDSFVEYEVLDVNKEILR